MAENKTQPTEADVTAFLDAVPNERRRAEGHALRELMTRVTGAPAVMWGPTMIGFGSQHYTGKASEGDWLVVGFSPRAAALSIYGVYDGYAAPDPAFDSLGPHTTGKGCLYVKRLDAIDLPTLEALVRRAWDRAQE